MKAELLCSEFVRRYRPSVPRPHDSQPVTVGELFPSKDVSFNSLAAPLCASTGLHDRDDYFSSLFFIFFCEEINEHPDSHNAVLPQNASAQSRPGGTTAPSLITGLCKPSPREIRLQARIELLTVSWIAAR